VAPPLQMGRDGSASTAVPGAGYGPAAGAFGYFFFLPAFFLPFFLAFFAMGVSSDCVRSG